MKFTSLIIIFTCFALLGCNEKPKEDTNVVKDSLVEQKVSDEKFVNPIFKASSPHRIKNDSPKKNQNYKHPFTEEKVDYFKEIEHPDSLLAYFEEIEFDDVYFVKNELGHGHITEGFVDYRYDSLIYVAHNNKPYYRYIEGSHFIPLERFSYTKNIVGLIVMRTSSYSYTRKDLILYDTVNNILIYGPEISDHIGDAGSSYRYVSWLKDINGDGYLDIISKDFGFQPSDWNFDFDKGFNGVLSDSITIYRGYKDSFIPVLSEVIKDSVTTKMTTEAIYTKFFHMYSNRHYIEDVDGTEFDIDLKYYQDFNDFYGEEDDK